MEKAVYLTCYLWKEMKKKRKFLWIKLHVKTFGIKLAWEPLSCVVWKLKLQLEIYTCGEYRGLKPRWRPIEWLVWNIGNTGAGNRWKADSLEEGCRSKFENTGLGETRWISKAVTIRVFVCFRTKDGENFAFKTEECERLRLCCSEAGNTASSCNSNLGGTGCFREPVSL